MYDPPGRASHRRTGWYALSNRAPPSFPRQGRLCPLGQGQCQLDLLYRPFTRGKQGRLCPLCPTIPESRPI